MSEIDDGGAAFPRDDFHHGIPGMSLRDYAAIHDSGMNADAGTAYASAFNRDPHPRTGDTIGWAQWFAKADARLRYLRADAMIAARDGKAEL